MEATTCMAPAPCQGHIWLFVSVGSISPEAIALNHAVEVFGQAFAQTIMGPTGVPIIEGIASGSMIGPEVTLLGFTTARLKIFDGCFVDFDVASGEDFLADLLMD